MTISETTFGGLDAHCHLDLFPSPAEVIAECDAARIYTIAVTNAPRVYAHMRTLVGDSPYVRLAIGMHPELVEKLGHELDQMWPILEQTRYVGEIGLDYVTSSQTNRKEQLRVFETILGKCASYGNRVLTVHSRRSATDVISAVGSSFPGTVILHWYSGSQRDLQRAIAAGLYFSVNPAMTRSDAGRKLIAQIPRERLLTETDGPFVQASNRQPARPKDTREVIAYLAGIWCCRDDEAIDFVRASFLKAVGEF